MRDHILYQRSCTRILQRDDEVSSRISGTELYSVVYGDPCRNLAYSVHRVYRYQKGNVIPNNDIKLGKQLLLIVAYSVAAVLSEVSSYNCTSLIPIIVQAPLSFTIEILLTGVADYVMFKAVPDKIQVVQMLLAVICSVCFVL